MTSLNSSESRYKSTERVHGNAVSVLSNCVINEFALIDYYHTFVMTSLNSGVLLLRR